MLVRTGAISVKLSRDWVIVGFSLLMGAYEIVLGGARPAVLTFISGLLLTPVVMRIDAARHRRDNSEDDK